MFLSTQEEGGKEEEEEEEEEEVKNGTCADFHAKSLPILSISVTIDSPS